MLGLFLLSLLGLVMLAVVVVAVFGIVPGFMGLVMGILARGQPEPQSSVSRQEAVSNGKQALIAAGIYSAAFATLFAINTKINLWLLLIAEPALMLGVAAILLARSSGPRGFRVLDLMLLICWIALTIAIPIQISALQSDREAWWTIANSRMQLTIADKTMEEGYGRAVKMTAMGTSSVHTRQTYDWARIGLSDAQEGLRAVEHLTARTTNGTKQQRLSRLHDEFTRQIKRYEEFVSGLGGKP